ncbi:ECF RNA polymerase sigma factor SigL [compost metagenome]
MPLYKTCSDQELSSFLAQEDGDAFAEIYNRYWALLFRHARRMTKDDDLAKDIVQDVFISLWDKATERQFNFSLSSYLYTTVRNRILNMYDKEKVRSNYLSSLTEFISHGENVTDHLLRERQLSARIEHEISLLPRKMRTIFEMSRKENMSYKVIAADLELSDNTVKKQISNAIKILRLKLGTLISLLSAILYLINF